MFGLNTAVVLCKYSSEVHIIHLVLSKRHTKEENKVKLIILVLA